MPPLGGINESSRLMDAAITTNGGYGISDISLTHVLVQNTAEVVEGTLTLRNVMMDATCSMAAASISLNEVTLLVAGNRFASRQRAACWAWTSPASSGKETSLAG